MKERLDDKDIEKALQRIISNKTLLKKEDTSILCYDITSLKNRVLYLRKTFPPKVVHTAAIKANPLIEILKVFKELGIGFESASSPEMYSALKVSENGSTIVFDSPAKTIEELEYALKNNVYVNADSFEELDRIDKILSVNKSQSKIGLRINPQVGTGKIEITSVAGEYSKFGVPISQREKILNAYEKYKWLNGIHLHVGSQGCEINMLVNGIEKVYELVFEINTRIRTQERKIEYFDMGGGFPVSYYKKEKAPSLREYVNEIEKRVPELFASDIEVITEFGRYISANTGWVASRVEYVKKDKDVDTAVIHVGAEMFIRRCYLPEQWHHEISVFDCNGKIKTGQKKLYTIAGPLCFAGDIIARKIELPEICGGDYIVIHDSGAYTFSMWSRYNSRQTPKIIGYEKDGEVITVLKERETPEDLYKFWS